MTGSSTNENKEFLGLVRLIFLKNLISLFISMSPSTIIYLPYNQRNGNEIINDIIVSNEKNNSKKCRWNADESDVTQEVKSR